MNKDETFTVYYASRASWNKGVDILIQVVKLLTKYAQKGICKIKFRIIAYGFLKYLYDEISKVPCVEVLDGPLPLEEHAKNCAKAHVTLFPSRYESFGLVALESLACGTPVCGFNVQGVMKDIIVKDHVLKTFVIKYCDVATLIKCLLRLAHMWYNHRDAYMNISKHARNVASNYYWTNIAKIFTRVLRIL